MYSITDKQTSRHTDSDEVGLNDLKYMRDYIYAATTRRSCEPKITNIFKSIHEKKKTYAASNEKKNRAEKIKKNIDAKNVNEKSVNASS